MRRIFAVAIASSFSVFSPLRLQAATGHVLQATPASHGILKQGDSLVSPSGKYRLDMQSDCNLVLYRVPDKHPEWDIRKQIHPGLSARPCFAAVQYDGNFVVYNGAPGDYGNYAWAGFSEEHTQDYYFLVVQDDANVVVYRGNLNSVGAPVWSIQTGALNKPKPGRCGGGELAKAACKAGWISPETNQFFDHLNDACDHCVEKAGAKAIEAILE